MQTELPTLTPLCSVICTEDVAGFGIEEERISGADTSPVFTTAVFVIEKVLPFLSAAFQAPGFHRKSHQPLTDLGPFGRISRLESKQWHVLSSPVAVHEMDKSVVSFTWNARLSDHQWWFRAPDELAKYPLSVTTVTNAIDILVERLSMTVTDATSIHEEFDGERLPPGQRRTKQFPVLSKSGIPTRDMETWEFTVTGAVDTDLSLSWSEFTDLPEETQCQDFHCVTGWSRFDNEFTGIPFPTIAERAGVHDDTVHVLFGSLDGYSTDLPLDECLREEVLFAFELDDQPLPSEHGGPLRVVTPHKYAYKGAKWVTSVEFLTESRRGYWEQRGYSKVANPWKEERYSSW